MRAAFCSRYGPPQTVRIRDVPDPVPKAGDVVIRVQAASISSGDARIRGANFPPGFALPARLALGLRGPRRPVLGVEACGVIDAIGDAVTQFRVGDAVIAFPGVRFGAHAERLVMPADGRIVSKPPNLSFVEGAALMFGGATALHFLDKAKARAGESFLVIGASGAVGVAAVQIARHRGLAVTGVSSAANHDLLRDLGAEQVVDYERSDMRALGQRWDIVLDAVGTLAFADAARLLKPGGRLLQIAAGLQDLLAAPFRAWRRGFAVIGGPAEERLDHMRELADLAARGVLRPVIDNIFPFEDIVSAHARVDSGRKRGSVVLAMNRADTPNDTPLPNGSGP